MAKTLTRSAIRIYGALSALGQGTSDVLSKLLPFFEPILKEQNGTAFDPEAFADAVRKAYKWNFNTDIVEVLIPRLEDAGWIVQATPGDGKSYYTVSVPEAEHQTDDEQTASRELREIAERFRDFARDLSPLTAIPLELEEYEDMLIEWLVYVEAFSEASIDFKTKVRKDDKGTLQHLVDVPNITSLSDEQKFLCARFVQHELKEGGSTSETLARIAAIGLLTEVVQDFVRPADAVEHTDLVVYLDAPIALELLGVSGNAARENTKAVVDELKRIGASTRIFAQSLEEMSGALNAVLENSRPTGPTATALARGEVLRDFVVNIAANPTPFLEKEGVQVQHRTMEQTPAEHHFFTDDQREAIFQAQTYQRNLHARQHDADITTLVMRQRRGRQNSDIFNARFVVMTRNGLLAQVVRKSCIEMGLLTRSQIPPIVHRRVLATAMWLRTGLGANELDVPKRMLLASCERVLAVRRGVVEAVQKATEALGDEEKVRQLNLLIQQDRSTQMLMDKTLGAASVVTKDNLPQLFDEMLHPYLEEERQRGKEAAKAEKQRGEQKARKLREKLDTEKRKAEETAAELKKNLEEDKSVIEALCHDVSKHLSSRRKWRWAISAALAVIFILPSLFSPSPVTIGIAVIFNALLALLTLTGNKLIGVTTDSEAALAALRAEAKSRRLDTKMNRFEVQWAKTRFSVQHSPKRSPDDLFSNSDVSGGGA